LNPAGKKHIFDGLKDGRRVRKNRYFGHATDLPPHTSAWSGDWSVLTATDR